MDNTGYCPSCPNPIECYQLGRCWPPAVKEKADDRLGATACSPVFEHEYQGTFVTPPARAKVGDVASNRHTGHSSKIAEALERSDGKIYAILESGVRCVLPGPNWSFQENAKGHPARDENRPPERSDVYQPTD